MNTPDKPKKPLKIPIWGAFLLNAGDYLATWFLMDGIYIYTIFTFFPGSPISRFEFLIAHIMGMVIATIVMFAGLGAGVLWIPILTFLHVKPSEAVSISLFTQITGKGIGSFNYFRSGLIDMKVSSYFIPFAFIGVALGYGAGFIISQEYERMLLYLFVGVAFYLLAWMIASLNQNPNDYKGPPDPDALKKSRMIVIISSFFTGLLSIGNNDWLIPHMERHLNMNTSRAIATGLFVMFTCSLFFLFLTTLGVFTGIQQWPQSSPVLFATCSGVIMGGQIGTRLVHVSWLKNHQKHAFILMLCLSIIHLLW
ncbi:MAG: sulfite exporter TauE/SafE family protein [Proteobacteria bacterium]|nr:sulfite exporter TauE/SafE family protein [Pseudomonadota bacterium]